MHAGANFHMKSLPKETSDIYYNYVLGCEVSEQNACYTNMSTGIFSPVVSTPIPLSSKADTWPLGNGHIKLSHGCLLWVFAENGWSERMSQDSSYGIWQYKVLAQKLIEKSDNRILTWRWKTEYQTHKFLNYSLVMLIRE